MLITNTLFGLSITQKYQAKADALHLDSSRYWQLLLHINKGISEIDTPAFFLSPNGKYDAKAELHATIDAFLTPQKDDDNASVCRFPARYEWLKEQLNASEFIHAKCIKYNALLKKVDPQSLTLVFPSAHINSPASMFGHTFLRINSSYHSRLLSYAINYAAQVDASKENGFMFALKGLSGGYNGKYSLLPYYEKLKEYRDTEQRDIWEYDLDFTPEETQRMFRHIWELHESYSKYYFFTQNCSYNMLWLLEIARENLHLREHFLYQVTPLETLHVAQEQHIIDARHYRASKRTLLLRYEEVLGEKNTQLAVDFVQSRMKIEKFLKEQHISKQQQRFLLEASIEYLQYKYNKGKIDKEIYLQKFHELTTIRAHLAQGKNLKIKTPPNPLDGHRALRMQLGLEVRGESFVKYIGFRPAYHDLEDSNYGFLRGTQIEFMDIVVAYSKQKLSLYKATLLSVSSLSQRTGFIKSFSWRTRFGWDQDYLSDDANFYAGVGAGYSWGNKLAYTYVLIDPLFYMTPAIVSGVGGSIGIKIDTYKFMNTNLELTYRMYDTGEAQKLLKLSQSFRISQNTQIMLNYDYKEKKNHIRYKENNVRMMFKYYF